MLQSDGLQCRTLPGFDLRLAAAVLLDWSFFRFMYSCARLRACACSRRSSSASCRCGSAKMMQTPGIEVHRYHRIHAVIARCLGQLPTDDFATSAPLTSSGSCG
jgi:hypothetical protein